MNSKKYILIISYQFPPDTGSVQRVTKFVKYLPEFGWHPIVITRKIDTYRFSDTKNLKDISGDIKIIRTGFTNLLARMRKTFSGLMTNNYDINIRPSTSSGSLGNNTLFKRFKITYNKILDWIIWPDRAIGWMPFALFVAIKLVLTKNVRVVYIVSPPHSTHLVGVLLKLITRVKWVADFRDPWANDPDIHMPTKLHRLAHEWAEKIVVRSANQVITTTDFHTEYMKKRIPSDCCHTHTITNGCDLADFENLPKVQSTEFIITYAGGFYAKRQPTSFFKALKHLHIQHPELANKIKVQFIGDSHKLTKNEVAKFDLYNCVQFTGYLDYRTTLEKLTKSSVFLLVVHNDKLIAQTSIPAKLFEYMAVGRPVLAISPPGAAAELVKVSQCGIVIDPGEIDKIEKAILNFYYQSLNNGLTKFSLKSEVLKQFDRKTLTKNLASLLNEVY